MLTGCWGSGHRECPHTLYPCSLLNIGQAKLFGGTSHTKLRLRLKVTLPSLCSFHLPTPQVGREWPCQSWAQNYCS